jgi:hypothetical protein
VAQRYRQVLLEEAALAYGLTYRPDLGKPDPAWEPVPWENVACLPATADDLAGELGLVFQRTHEEGLGDLEVAVLDLPSGARVALACYEGGAAQTVVKLLPEQFVNGFRGAREAADSDGYWGTDDRAARAQLVDATLDRVQDGVLDELAGALGPHLARVTWLRPVLGRRASWDRPDATWELSCQDDAGHRHLMQDRLTEQEARDLAARYESRGHKQMYWAERGRRG